MAKKELVAVILRGALRRRSGWGHRAWDVLGVQSFLCDDKASTQGLHLGHLGEIWEVAELPRRH